MAIFQKHQLLLTLVLVAFIALTLPTTTAKTTNHDYNFYHFRKNNGWEYLTRFNAAPDTLTATITVKLNSKETTPSSVFNITIIAIPAPLWPG